MSMKTFARACSGLFVLLACLLPPTAAAQYAPEEPPTQPPPVVSEAIVATYQGQDGILAQVFQTNCLGCHSSQLSGAQRNGAPPGLNWDIYQTARDFGDRIIARAVTLQSMPPAGSGVPTLNEEQRQALLAWRDAGYPLEAAQTEPDPPVFYYESTTQELVLPVVIVGQQTYSAELALRVDEESPTGFAFELTSAALTDQTSETPVEYDAATGLVTVPHVELYTDGEAAGTIYTGEFQFVEGSNPLYFHLTVLMAQ